jgi:hypothetical protein
MWNLMTALFLKNAHRNPLCTFSLSAVSAKAYGGHWDLNGTQVETYMT